MIPRHSLLASCLMGLRENKHENALLTAATWALVYPLFIVFQFNLQHLYNVEF